MLRFSEKLKFQELQRVIAFLDDLFGKRLIALLLRGQEYHFPIIYLVPMT